MAPDRIWFLLGKKLTDEASPEELRELEQLLKEHPEIHYPIQNIADLWRLPSHFRPSASLEAYEQHLSRLLERGIVLQTQEANEARSLPVNGFKRRRRLTFAGMAIGIAAILITAINIFNNQQLPPKMPVKAAFTKEVSTKAGARSRLILPDGSQVYLNSGSHLHYDPRFQGNLREVELSGEAYFDVVHDASRPFIIHTKKIDIHVLGTSFNVKSYPGDQTTETSLIRGRIEVRIKDRPDQKMILNPSEKLIIRNDADPASERKIRERTPMITVSNVNLYPKDDSTVIETAWTENKLIFRDMSFSDLVREMQRWYGVQIILANPSLQEVRFTGIFEKENCEQALKALQISQEFKYTLDKDRIVITK